MPITSAAKKANKRSKKLAERNKTFKLRMKMAIKKLLKTAEKGETVSPEMLNETYKYIDKAWKIGIIKKKNAARKKSRVARAANKKVEKKDK